MRIKLGLKTVSLLLFLLIIPSFLSILKPGFFPMQDDLQAFRIHQMDKCILDLQIPCRWVPDMGYGYGYPQFNFYAPLVFYIGEVFHLIGFQFIDSVKILFGLGFVLAAFSMFVFLRSIFGIWPAFIGSILYTYAPFKAVEVYVRGSLSEFWAFVFFPLIFWSINKLIKTNKFKYVLLLVLSVGALLLTHNLMSMIFLPITFVWALILMYLEKNWWVVGKIIGGVILGIGLASFYLFPAVFEKPFVHLNSVLSGYFDYRQHFVNLNQLFISNYFEYGSSFFGDADTVSLSTGQIHWILGLIGVLLSLFYFKKEKKLAVMILILALLELIVLFLIHQRSSFVWEKITILHWLQFPWRFLALSIFLLSILSSSTICFISKLDKPKISSILGVLIIILVFILHIRNFTPSKWLEISDQDKFSGSYWEKQLTISIFDYLPIYAKLPPGDKAPQLPEVLNGNVSVLSYEKNSYYQYGQINVLEPSTIRLPLFDFPGMKVSVNGERIKHYNNDCRMQQYCLGLISFNIEPGLQNIWVGLQNTFIRTFGNAITLLSFILILLFILQQKLWKKS